MFLVGADMGRIEKTVRWARDVSVEDRVDGLERFAYFARAGAMVLSAQRDDDAVGVHA